LSHSGKKPLQCLQKAINKRISVKLKSDLEYRGKMTNVDSYMNLILVDAQEYSKGVLSAQFGKVVIRGNNVLFIKFEDDI
jgi:small nuclear ribonucleoprotein